MTIKVSPITLSVIMLTLTFADENLSRPYSPTDTESLSSLQTYKLEHSIAIGSPLESDVVNIPGHISVIESEEIYKSPNTKITDIVKKTAGVRIDNDTNFNPRPKIKIRGINYGTLVMLDGLILSDLEGENRIINQIFLEDIQRVEIARGSYSSLYGTGAIGGVINFITAMPNTFEASLITGYGTEFQSHTADKNLFKLYVSIGDAFFDKRLRVKFNAGYKGSGGYPSFPTYFAAGDSTAQDNNMNGFFVDKAGQTIIGTGGDRNYHIYDTRFKAEYDISDADMLSLMLGFSSYDYSFKNFISYLKDAQGNPTDLIDNKDYFVGSGLGGKGRYSHLYGNLTYTHNFTDSLLKITLSSMNLFSIWQDALQGSADRFGGAGSTQDTDSSSNYLDVIYQSELFSRHKLAIASQFRYYTYTQDQRNMTNWLINSTRTDSRRKFGNEAFVASMYANWEAQWLDNLSTNLGVRYDYWHNFNGYLINNLVTPNDRKDNINNTESIFSPKFSISYTPLEILLFKASIGSGFRMPTMRDMYQFTHASNYWELNPDLKKESALSFDIGAELRTQYITTSLYYYQLEMRDMIYRSGKGSKDDPWRYINAGKGRINGIEYSAFVPLWSDFILEGNYTLTLAKVLENPARPQSVGKQLIGVPKHMANIALHYMPKYGLYASVWAYYTPAFYNDDVNSTPLSDTYGYYEGQFSLNAKIGYIWKMGLDASLSFFNLTNNRYYDFYRVAGASFYAQVGYKF
uniref:TonB-dependent receptor n=1 Tax=uncultured Helicobacter sp. TaxID=175537 RepID=A0A650EKV9_9HELI|nr:TonB-dependent receptor [uncultured Helicobacter sp.]